MVDHQILRFEISVNDVLSVKVLQAEDYLGYVELRFLVAEEIEFCDQLEHLDSVHELKEKVASVLIAIGFV